MIYILDFIMSRKIVCSDAHKWLSKNKAKIFNVVTGIPDHGELGGINLDEYLKFLKKSATLIFNNSHTDGYVIFIQTDRKIAGKWIDKSTIINTIAEKLGWQLKWHKIVLQREIGKCDIHRPSYSHMLCYSVNAGPGEVTQDVFPVSSKIYANGTPLIAANFAVDFVKRYSPFKSLVDPFVGQGTVVALAHARGLDAIGIDIDPQQCLLAEQCQLTPTADLTAKGNQR